MDEEGPRAIPATLPSGRPLRIGEAEYWLKDDLASEDVCNQILLDLSFLKPLDLR